MPAIIITGANGNLGTAVTKHFLQLNYQVIATVLKEKDKEELPAHPHLQTEVVDLSKEEEADAFVSKAIEKYKKIDATLLLVGGFAMGKIKDTKIGDIKKQLT